MILNDFAILQIISGCITGCIGFLIPSSYERSLSFEQRKKVWWWQKSNNLTFISVILLLIKYLGFLAVLAVINVEFRKYFHYYEMACGKSQPFYATSVICFLFFTKFLRAIYFKWKLR